MADEPVVTQQNVDIVNDAAKANESYTQTVIAAGDANSKFTDIQRQSADSFVNIKNLVDKSTNAIKNLTDSYLTAVKSKSGDGLFQERDARNIALFTTELIGAKNNIDNFSGLSISREPFLGPISAMTDAIKNGGGLLNTFADLVMQQFGDKLPKGFKGTSAEIVQFGIKMLTSAGNMIHSRDAMIQLAAATGTLNEVYKGSGENLEQINELSAKQQSKLTSLGGALGMTTQETTQYYIALGKVPGMLLDMSNTSGSATDQVDKMANSLKFAKAAGWDTNSMASAMSSSFQSLGLRGMASLDFFEKISETNNNLGASLDNTRTTILQLANSFSVLTNRGVDSSRMASGLTDITNKYAQALKEQGVNEEQALKISSSMVGVIGNLDIAKRAFLSAQTGGPGGLMGAFQIEKDLREGKITDVFKKVKDQMQKQLGPIVSIDQASQSEGAAQQRTRQEMMLTQGPLGQFAKNPEEAGRILDAFASGTENFKDLKIGGLAETIDKGATLAKQQTTEFAHLNESMQRLIDSNNALALNRVQEYAAAAGSKTSALSAEDDGTSAAIANRRDKLLQNIRGSEDRSLKYDGQMQDVAKNGPDNQNTASENLTEVAGNIINPLMAMGDDLKTNMTKTVKEGIKSRLARMKSAGSSASANENLQQYINDNSNYVDSDDMKQIQQVSPGLMLKPAVDNAAQQNVNTPTTVSTAPTDNSAGTIQAIQNSRNNDNHGTIDVMIKGHCIKCQTEIEDSGQVRTMNIGSKA